MALTTQLALGRERAHMTAMAGTAPTTTTTSKGAKAGVLGRSPATGRIVLAPVASKKTSVSDKRITAAVKSVLAKKK